jgi:outer membrane protein assembly factor BamB
MSLWLLASWEATGEGGDWPRWRGPRGDGSWVAPKLPERWPDGSLPVRWKQSLGGGYAGVSAVGVATRRGSEPARVVTMDRQTDPREVERILCFDADSGQPLWTVSYDVRYGDLDYGNGPRAQPTIHEGRVYTLGALGHFACVDLRTGKRLWLKDLAAEEKAQRPTWGFAASPVLYKHLVIVHVGARPGGCLLAFDARSGRLAWRGGSDPAGYCTPILIEHNARHQLVSWTPENILSLDPDTGRELWKIPYKVTYGVSIATPIFRDSLVFVSGYWEGSKAIRLGSRPTDASLAWEENRTLRGLMSQPLYRDGYVYSLDKDRGLTCFALATGRKVWDDGNRLTPRGRNPQATLVWLEGDNSPGRAIALNSEGELVLCRLSPQGYEEDSRTKIIGRTWAHPAYAGRFCFARSDQSLVCVDLAEGP